MEERKPTLGQEPEIPETLNFAVERIPVRGGFRYDIYFETEEEAAKAVETYWNLREVGKLPTMSRSIKSGMLKPTEHDLTAAGRTAPRKPTTRDLEKHPDKKFIVNFNGNEGALSKEGEAALRKLGFIE